MRVTFLGTGTSHGIPMIGCDCAVCRSSDPRNQRLRPSIFVEHDHLSVLVDATPDFRMQALRARIGRMDAVLLTHSHADHILGLDDLRAFTGKNDGKMPLYGSAKSLADVGRIFPYACTEKPAWPGLPSFELHPVEPNVEFQISNFKCRAVPLLHRRMTVYGFVVNNTVAYLTDCSTVPEDVIESIRGVPVLVLDALRHRPHPAHLTIEAALEIATRVGPGLTWLTHLCHEVDHETTEAGLPQNVRLAYDQLQIEVNNDECCQMP
jgi:phosphoribosyl 1,2-cyclic phosphate phosphodiesterase